MDRKSETSAATLKDMRRYVPPGLLDVARDAARACMCLFRHRFDFAGLPGGRTGPRLLRHRPENLSRNLRAVQRIAVGVGSFAGHRLETPAGIQWIGDGHSAVFSPTVPPAAHYWNSGAGSLVVDSCIRPLAGWRTRMNAMNLRLLGSKPSCDVCATPRVSAYIGS
jgi:hypothetical protein